MQRGLLSFVLVFTFLLLSVQPTYAKPTPNRLILTLLAPKIQHEINNYYKSKLIELPTYSPYLGPTNLLVEYFDSYMNVNAVVTPYIGPHIDVGLDLISFKVYNDGTVEVVGFEHVKNFELPANWKHIIKK